jgi:hypothetical protein
VQPVALAKEAIVIGSGWFRRESPLFPDIVVGLRANRSGHKSAAEQGLLTPLCPGSFSPRRRSPDEKTHQPPPSASTQRRPPSRGRSIFAAYRGDWLLQRDFFLAKGFAARREMVNYVMDLTDMPTPAARVNSAIGPLTPKEVPAIFALAPSLFRARTTSELEQHLFHNRYFPPEALFGIRPRSKDAPLAVGILIDNPAYASPRQVDSAMPCFRAGAFGCEGLQVKRMNGLFSMAVSEGRGVSSFGLDLLAHATFLLKDSVVETLCAQVPSDAVQLIGFYKQYFRRQGSFPLYERDL